MRSTSTRTIAAAIAITIFALFATVAAPRPAAAQPRETSGGRTGPSANVERIDSLGGITEYRLKSNGMNILLVPNRSVPVITFFVVYHVG